VSRRVASDSENRLVRAALDDCEVSFVRAAKFFGCAVLIYLVLYGVQNAYSREAYRTTADYYTGEFLGLGKPYVPEMYNVVKCYGNCKEIYVLISAINVTGLWEDREKEYFTSFSRCMAGAGEFIRALDAGTRYVMSCNYRD